MVFFRQLYSCVHEIAVFIVEIKKHPAPSWGRPPGANITCLREREFLLLINLKY